MFRKMKNDLALEDVTTNRMPNTRNKSNFTPKLPLGHTIENHMYSNVVFP